MVDLSLQAVLRHLHHTGNASKGNLFQQQSCLVYSPIITMQRYQQLLYSAKKDRKESLDINKYLLMY
jgi:hypothetical protein